MKEEGRRLEVHKPRRESRVAGLLGTSLLSATPKPCGPLLPPTALGELPECWPLASQPHFTPRVAALGSQWSLSPPTQTFVEAFRRHCC